MPPPYAVIEPPAPEAQRYGRLVDSAVELTDGVAEANGWGNGVTWSPRSCDTSGIADPCADDPGKTIEEGRPAVEEAEPFVVWTEERCSTMGATREELEERARAALTLHESAQMAAELWAGTQAQASTWPNLYLTDGGSSAVNGGDPMPLTGGVALLENAALAGCHSRIALHAPPIVAALMYKEGMVERDPSGLLLTALGNVLIADAGYPTTNRTGGAPAAGQGTMFATTIPRFRRGAIDVLGSDGSGVEKRTNTITLLAERLAVVTVEPCCRYDVTIDLSAYMTLPT